MTVNSLRVDGHNASIGQLGDVGHLSRSQTGGACVPVPYPDFAEGDMVVSVTTGKLGKIASLWGYDDIPADARRDLLLTDGECIAVMLTGDGVGHGYGLSRLLPAPVCWWTLESWVAWSWLDHYNQLAPRPLTFGQVRDMVLANVARLPVGAKLHVATDEPDCRIGRRWHQLIEENGHHPRHW